ncbi:predicted protein [Nematostella vectensis]|uniref:Protein kinase domain-containing protein n=1 Tax=Nematostella vectensis TaxID=45351 RepID=A7T7X5_NEMVE|nr:predicted protein [Nematostella vectensis]|eukprot:XP_001620021.1 hypothetical protein NEMVEDRAFT_v1g223563 [Nematostella vectensis]
MAKMNTFQSPVPGTQKYMAPETFVFAATNSAIYGPEIDIFSFGMTMLETILGRLPSFMENPLAEEGAAGASTSVVATGLVIGGFVGSFFTFGATVPLMIAGGSVAAAGGLTTFGAKMTEVVLSREQFKKVEDTIAEDKAESEGLRQSLEELDRLITKSVNRIFEDDKEPSNLSGKAIEDVMKHFQKITGMKIMDTEQLHPVKSSARGVGAVIAATSSVITVGTASSRLGSAVFDTLSAASRVTHIAGFVTSIIALPIDAYFLITSIRDIKNHTPSEVADRIRDIRSKMQCPEEHEIPGLIEAYITAKVAEVAKVQLKSPNDTFELVDDLDEFVQQDEVSRINALFDDGELTISDDHFLEK